MTERHDVIREPSGRTEGGVQTVRKRSFANPLRNPRVGPTAIIVLAALAGLVWLIVESGGGSSSQTNANQPVVLSRAGLTTLAKTVPQPIYWIGPRENTMYEVTKTPDRVYVRYLPSGAKAGDSRPFLTVGTYAMVNAYTVTKTSAAKGSTVALDVPKGGIAAYNKNRPTNVYVAFPGSNFQVELYDPNASSVRQLAIGGSVRPVVAVTEGKGPVAVSPEDLKSLAASLRHPVYWVGPQANVTYELTETNSGWTYVRYLPKGAGVGGKGLYLTVATYPMKNALAVTRRGAKGHNTVTLKLPNGGIAVYTKPYATNIRLAYPGENVQVEVYDPLARVPRKLVTSSRVVPVG